MRHVAYVGTMDMMKSSLRLSLESITYDSVDEGRTVVTPAPALLCVENHYGRQLLWTTADDRRRWQVGSTTLIYGHRGTNAGLVAVAQRVVEAAVAHAHGHHGSLVATGIPLATWTRAVRSFSTAIGCRP